MADTKQAAPERCSGMGGTCEQIAGHKYACACNILPDQRWDTLASRPDRTTLDFGNYVCNDVTYPTQVVFDNGRVVSIVPRDDGSGLPWLAISPKAEYPKPCGICDGVIQSKADLDWHGYGNCRDIPDAVWAGPNRTTPPLVVPQYLIDSALKYGDNYSTLGKLNLAAYIGERLVALVKQWKEAVPKRTPQERCPMCQSEFRNVPLVVKFLGGYEQDCDHTWHKEVRPGSSEG